MRARASLLIALFGGCATPGTVASPEPAASEPPVAEPKAPAPIEPVPSVAAPTPVAAPEPAKPLLAIEAEWDETSGKDAIVLHPDARLVAGSNEGTASLPTSSGYFFGQQAKLEVVRFGHPKHARALVLAIPTADEEDPANVYQVFVADGPRLRRIYEATIGSYGVVPLEFAGDGTVSYVEDGWAACERTKFPTKVKRDRIVLRMNADGMLAEAKRRATKSVQDCGMLAACPFVYVLGDGEPALQGEILRNLRGAAAHAEQSLPVAIRERGVLRVRIAEEKPEVTRLDAIALVVDGVTIPPRSCGASPSPAYCAADRRYELLREGDALELAFDVPELARTAEIVASGYYTVPRGTVRF